MIHNPPKNSNYTYDRWQSFSRRARGQEKETKNKFRGSLASLPPERNFTWFFDGLQQYYERLPIHPPKDGLPANNAIDSWPWLSRVSVLGGPVPYLLFPFVYVKHAVCSMVSRQQHTRTPLVRRITLTGNV